MKITNQGILWTFTGIFVAATSTITWKGYESYKRMQQREDKPLRQTTVESPQELKELKRIAKTLKEFHKKTCRDFNDCMEGKKPLAPTETALPPPESRKKSTILKIERKP